MLEDMRVFKAKNWVRYNTNILLIYYFEMY